MKLYRCDDGYEYEKGDVGCCDCRYFREKYSDLEGSHDGECRHSPPTHDGWPKIRSKMSGCGQSIPKNSKVVQV